MAAVTRNLQKRPCNSALVSPAQQREQRERGRHVQRSGQPGSRHCAAPSIRSRELEAAKKLNFVRGAHPAIKIFQVRATTERDVLAIIHMLAAREHIRRGTPTQVGPLFEQTYAEAGFS